MIKKIGNKEYTHLDYRKVKIIHIVNLAKESHFFYKGKEITKEEADTMVMEHNLAIKKKNQKSSQ